MFSLHFRVCKFKRRYPGARGTRAALAHGRTTPCQLGNGGTRAALMRGRSPPAHQGLGARTLLWRAAGAPLPTKGWGRPFGGRMFFFAFQGMYFGKKVYNFDPFFDWTSSFCLYEKTFFVKHQQELYLVDV